MSGLLEQATARESAATTETLREVARVEHASKVLAVAEASGGVLVLCREREVGVVGDDGKRSRENGTEKVLKRTAALADFAHAVEAGLL
jgi:hypothetical protein